MPKGDKAVTEANGDVDERRFARTIREMRSTPPKPHEKLSATSRKDEVQGG